jgi:hypothetical protein
MPTSGMENEYHTPFEEVLYFHSLDVATGYSSTERVLPTESIGMVWIDVELILLPATFTLTSLLVTVNVSNLETQTT